MTASLLVALVPMLMIVACNIWVYADATCREARGRPVIPRMGILDVARPRKWLIFVPVVWVLFFPM